jgi:AraC family transcriptional regulator, regulatory protein of adaptative response / DNA-3-methyladenine glycosylase II
VSLDSAHCYEVVKARDARFDGLFFVGVSTTGVYCRPICRVRTPRADRCSYFKSAASAEAAGFRPCLRCRPELAPGAAPVDATERLANAAVQRIEAGALSELRVDALAAELGVSARQLHRVVEAHYGVSPLSLAQTQRLLLAKQLLTDTSLRAIDVAFGSGFASVRQFNRLFRARYRLSPLSLRKQALRSAKADSAPIVLKLGFRPPLAWPELISFLAGRGALGTEKIIGNSYLRTVRVGPHSGYFQATPAGDSLLEVRVAPGLLPVLPEVRARLRRLFDLDADPLSIDRHLAQSERLRGAVQKTPGLRVPGAFCGFELALRAVLGQQISVKAATTIYGRFAELFGGQIETPEREVNRLPPLAGDVADAKLRRLIDLGLTERRAETVRSLARAIVDGELELEPPFDPVEARRALQEISGIGPWTAEYVALRALRDPDAFPASDLGLLSAVGGAKPAALAALSAEWRPFRAYAAVHLWSRAAAGG